VWKEGMSRTCSCLMMDEQNGRTSRSYTQNSYVMLSLTDCDVSLPRLEVCSDRDLTKSECSVLRLDLEV
jgi:hypothetical protein